MAEDAVLKILRLNEIDYLCHYGIIRMLIENKDELRCECGSLLAKLFENRLEIKCRRCKRVWVIPVILRKEVIEIDEIKLKRSICL